MEDNKQPIQNEIQENELNAETINEEILNAEDYNKRNYVKISPEFYIQTVEKEEGDEGDVEIFKIFNPITNLVETRELTDDEKHQIRVFEIKQSKKTFNPLSYKTKVIGKKTAVSATGGISTVREKILLTNVTVNKYGVDYKKKRNKKKKLTKASRKANRR